jgi:hypothetical protein
LNKPSCGIIALRINDSIAIEPKEETNMAIPSEGVEGRFARDYGSMSAERKLRGLDKQSDERQARRYVKPDGTSMTGKTRD